MNTYLCIEDHDIVRAGLRMVITQMNGEATLHEAASLADGVAILEQHPNVDLIILDANLPDASGVSGLVTLRDQFPGIPVVIMTGQVEGPFMIETLMAGAIGFIPKSAIGTRLRAALALVQAGEKYIPEELLGWLVSNGATVNVIPPTESAVMEVVAERNSSDPADRTGKRPDPLSNLTERQVEVVQLLAEGYSNKEICRALDLSLGTVKNHVAAILNTLGTTSRCKVIHILHEHDAA